MEKKFLGGYSPDWYAAIEKSRDLVYQYNNLHPSQLERRYEILKELLGQCYEETLIEPPFRCDDGKNVFIGRYFYANYNLTILDHMPITIGNNVLIGSGAKVLGPFTVGDHSKIAANAVVLTEVPPHSTCVGVPARVVRIGGKRVCEEELDQVHIPDPVSQELCRLQARLDKLEKALIKQEETREEK